MVENIVQQPKMYEKNRNFLWLKVDKALSAHKSSFCKKNEGFY